MKRKRDGPSVYILLLLVCLHGFVKTHEDEAADSTTGSIVVPMPEPGPRGVKHNDYMCTGASVPEQDLFITHFEPRADPLVAHHMLLFGCSRKAPRGSWSCKSNGLICDGEPHILFAWALNASGLHLPPDVGVQVGPSVHINSVVIQIHYGYPEKYPDHVTRNKEAMVLHTTRQRQWYVAGIYLMGTVTSIRAGAHHSFVDTSCVFKGPKNIYPFAFRTHAHHLGEQIVGYAIKDGEWQLIGTRSPQDAQAFYPAANKIEVSANDRLAMRCVFNMEGKSHSVHMGANSEDEMCNFYIMYYTENDGRSLFSNECWLSAPPTLVYPRLPSLTTPPATPTATPTVPIITTDSSGSSDHEQEEEDNYECPKPLPPGSSNSRCVNATTTTTPIPVPPTTFQTPKTSSKTPESVQTPMSSVRGDTPTPHSPFFEGGDGVEFESLGLVPAEDWPLNGVDIPGVTLGQVSAVAVDKDGSVHVLHRGSVVWDYGSFNFDFTYRRKGNGPIKVPTLLKFSSIGAPERAWGESQFYMPHGLTIDPKGNFWITDVATHQVFKFTKLGSSEPAMILGTQFKPGSGFGHFCQPASVAVENAGNFYIADGYCNHRILKFSASGQLLETWQTPIDGLSLYVPHKLTLSAAQDKLYVADRENGRVIAYSTATGRGEVFSGRKDLDGKKPYAIFTNGSSDWPLHGVFGGGEGSVGFSLDKNGEVISTWGPEGGFEQPHDLTVDPVNKAVYITEIGPNRIWKFVPIDLKPIDITDLLDSNLPLVPTGGNPNDNNQYVDSDHDSPISNPPPPASSTTSSSTFVHGVLPDQPLKGPDHNDIDHEDHDEDDDDHHHDHLEGGEEAGPGENGSAANIIESSSKVKPHDDKSKKDSNINLGVFVAIFVMAAVFVLILIGVLKEHKYLRFRGAVCLRRGKVPIHSNGKANGSTPRSKSNPKKTLHSLLGPSQLGFSRLRTYDSDSEEEEFPVFNRV